MHTTKLFKPDDFAFIRDGLPVGMPEVIPDFTVLDRLGIVMRGPADGVGASGFILACVTAFYDLYLATGEPFFTYPDYFTLQATEHPAYYSSLDIWPNHKSIQVQPDPEQILQTLNDRGVNLLLVPEGPVREHTFDRVALSSARRRIRACYVYGCGGKVSAPDFCIRRQAGPLEPYIRKVFDSIQDEGLRGELLSGWEKVGGDAEEIEESYRSVGLDEALALLAFK
ncbi:MAG: hypothetical protein EXS64_17620 [Candidatus Latescibacteria bacterium]|nr:hypothetical protein [Candidatus Latescibacterota bacterium]